MPIPVGVGRKFLSAVIAKEDAATLMEKGDLTPLFTEPELPLYLFIVDHLTKHKSLPSPEAILAGTGASLTEAKDKASYYLGGMVDREVKNKLTTAMQVASESLQADNMKPMEALDKLSDAVFGTRMFVEQTMVTDLRDAYESVWLSYLKAMKTDSLDGFKFGWPSLDAYSSGAQPGDLLSLVGRPGIGKTWLLLSLALHVWMRYDVPVMFISTEMAPKSIHTRLASMVVGKPHKWLNLGGVDSSFNALYEERLLELKNKDNPLWVIDGKFSTTVPQIAGMVARLRPAMVFVDGAYMLRHEDKLNRYERVAENCEMLKQHIATDMGVPVFASWQFSREAEKKLKQKKPGEVTLADIGYSDAIGQQSTVVLGMFEAESVETMRRRRVNIMKGREGEVGEFHVRWDFSKMDFSEIDPKTFDPMVWI